MQGAAGVQGNGYGKQCSILVRLKKFLQSRHRWLRPVIQAIYEVEIGKIKV
jgi:hypothetical protein